MKRIHSAPSVGTAAVLLVPAALPAQARRTGLWTALLGGVLAARRARRRR